jgi:hypothetical protein
MKVGMANVEGEPSGPGVPSGGFQFWDTYQNRKFRDLSPPSGGLVAFGHHHQKLQEILPCARRFSADYGPSMEGVSRRRRPTPGARAPAPADCRCSCISHGVRQTYTRTQAGRWIIPAKVQNGPQRSAVHPRADAQPLGRQRQFQYRLCPALLPPRVPLHQGEPNRPSFLEPFIASVEGVLRQPLFLARTA